MKKSTLDRAIDALLFEADTIGMPDIVYGIYDRPGPTGETDPDFEPTVPPEVPLKPTEMMAGQLANERPPIEDEDYAPTTVSDLRQAAQAIAGLVPPDQVEKFYRQSLELLDKMEEEEMSKNVAKPAQVAAEEEALKSESRRARRARLSRLLEALDDDDPMSPRYGERMRGRHSRTLKGWQSSGVEEEVPFLDDEPEPAPASPADEAQVLAALAKEFGYAGPSGLRQGLNRLYTLIDYLVNKVGLQRVEDLMGTVVPEFVEYATDLRLFDRKDAVVLMANPKLVRELDSFRYYFNGLYRPVYKKLLSDKEKEVRQKIADLGVPKAALDSVFNQVSGKSARKDSTIAKNLQNLPPRKAKEILSMVSQNFADLQRQMNDIPDTLLDLTHEKIDSMGDDDKVARKKKEAVIDAFKQAGEGGVNESRKRRRRA
jgi:hypothetical protein